MPTAQEQLEELRTLRRTLITGGGLKKIGEGDRVMEFTPPSIEAVEADIRRLESLLGLPPSLAPRARSRRVLF